MGMGTCWAARFSQIRILPVSIGYFLKKNAYLKPRSHSEKCVVNSQCHCHLLIVINHFLWQSRAFFHVPFGCDIRTICKAETRP